VSRYGSRVTLERGREQERGELPSENVGWKAWWVQIRRGRKGGWGGGPFRDTNLSTTGGEKEMFDSSTKRTFQTDPLRKKDPRENHGNKQEGK